VSAAFRLGFVEALCTAYQLYGILPHRLSWYLSGMIFGRLGPAFAPSSREAVRKRLSAIQGKDVKASDPRVNSVFRNFGRYLAEFFALHRVSLPKVCVEGQGYLDTLLRLKRGAVLLTAHLGNWELGAVYLQRQGLSMAVVALPHMQAGADALFNRQRVRSGVTVLAKGAGSVRRSLEWLKRGGCIGMLGDLNFGSRGVRMGFCGMQLDIPVGPAWLSLRSGAPLVPLFMIRENFRSFRLIVEQPIEPGDYRGVDSLERLVRSGATALERAVKRFPDQWLVFQEQESYQTQQVHAQNGRES